MPPSLFNIFKSRPRVESLLAQAEVAARSGDSASALELYATVIRHKPDLALAHYKQANLLRDRNQLEMALAGYDRAIALDSGYANALCNRGVVLERLNQLDAAEESYSRAVALNPSDALALYNRASVLRSLKRPEEALASLDQAIAIRPAYADAYCNRGLLLAELKQWESALASYDQAIEIEPTGFAAHFNRGDLLRKQKHWDAALASYDTAIELKSDYVEALCNRAVLFAELRRLDLAFADLERAIATKPEFAEAYGIRAGLYGVIQKYDAALEDCNSAIAFGPGLTDGYFQRANISIAMKNFEGAIADFTKMMVLKPDFPFLLGMRRSAQMSICDWSGLEFDIQYLIAGIQADEAVALPMAALALIDSEELHGRAAKIWTREENPGRDLLTPLPRSPVRDKIRIGYFSADFHVHPVAILMAEVFEQHDHSRFDVTAFSFGPNSRDAMRLRMEKAFPRFIDVRAKSDREIAMLAREVGLDIAVDLGGFTANSRPSIFALRAAPLQVNYLGYPGTMGAPYMDYLIADQTVIPESHQAHYSEKIVYLPHCYLPNDATRRIAETVYSREQLGLPSHGFVFCCFNNSFKLTPEVFDRWMRILQRVQHSVLWLSQGNASAAANLHREAKRRGMDSARIIFAERVGSPEEHLARLRVADLFLDTHPYNAHATAIDALWAGLPLLTYAGQSFAGRVGASLLSTLGIPELIAETPEQYEEMAVQLAGDAPRLTALRQQLARRHSQPPLFDGRYFARHLEAAYTAIHARYLRGGSPAHQHINRTAIDQNSS
jgi:protein O-GlcNAc transferase